MPCCIWEDKENRQEYLFNAKQYKDFILIFWPWLGHLSRNFPIFCLSLYKHIFDYLIVQSVLTSYHQENTIFEVNTILAESKLPSVIKSIILCTTQEKNSCYLINDTMPSWQFYQTHMNPSHQLFVALKLLIWEISNFPCFQVNCPPGMLGNSSACFSVTKLIISMASPFLGPIKHLIVSLQENVKHIKSNQYPVIMFLCLSSYSFFFI